MYWSVLFSGEGTEERSDILSGTGAFFVWCYSAGIEPTIRNFVAAVFESYLLCLKHATTI